MSVRSLVDDLKEQVRFLEASATAYDGGFEGEAKRLAVVIRTLVHDTRHSTSLLSQLGVKDEMRFVDTSTHVPPRAVLMGDSGLAMQRVQTGPGGEGRYVAPLDNLPPPRQNPPVMFREW